MQKGSPINILFPCHCKFPFLTKNPIVRSWRKFIYDRIPNYRYLPHELLNIESSEIIGDVHYIDLDPECPLDPDQFRSWDSLPKAPHYDIIWGINCNVYGMLTAPNRKDAEFYIMNYVTEFYEDVWKNLKRGGIFVFVINEAFGISYEEQVSRIKDMLFPKLKHKWEVICAPIKDLPLRLNTKAFGPPHKNTLVFRKI